jgi:hypothetical protein
MDPKAKQKTASLLSTTQAFRQLDPATQNALLRDLGVPRPDPYAVPMESPADLTARLRQGGAARQNGSAQPPAAEAEPGQPRAGTKPATETLAARAGALSDELNFPDFVAGLVHGTFDAIVDASIRQMETFADLVSAVAKGADQFTSDNITANQARDYLAAQHPRELMLDLSGSPRLIVRPNGDEELGAAPAWLNDYGLDGRTLDDDMVEAELVPLAQRKLGENRLQMLATMVLLGMNRVVVRDGTIAAKLKFRAAATDKTTVDYAQSQDTGSPGGSGWGDRGARTYQRHATMVSTVGVNAQQDTVLDASLYGEVRINFASETLPLERFADSARLALLQRNARAVGTQPATATQAPVQTAQPLPVAPNPITPVAPATPRPAGAGAGGGGQ